MLPSMAPAADCIARKMQARPGHVSTATDCPKAIGDASESMWRRMASAFMR